MFYKLQHKTYMAIYCCIDFFLYSRVGVQYHKTGFDPRLLSPVTSKISLQVENLKQTKANYTVLEIHNNIKNTHVTFCGMNTLCSTCINSDPQPLMGAALTTIFQVSVSQEMNVFQVTQMAKLGIISKVWVLFTKP